MGKGKKMLSDKNFSIGIDLGGTNLKIGLVDKQGMVVCSKTFPVGISSSSSDIIEAITLTIEGLCAKFKISCKDLQGIGIGVPGLIDARNGIIHYLVNIPSIKNFPIKKILEKKIKTKVFIDNDVNAIVLAEYRYGAGKGCKNLVCVAIGTGVGSGIIIDGKLYRGTHLGAGEIGHISINEKGPLCNCGSHGCLEQYIGNSAISRLTADMLKKHKGRTLIRKIAQNNKITPKHVYLAAKKGDKLAREIWGKVGFYLGSALADVINLIDPDKIIVGGGVSGAWVFIKDDMNKTVKNRAMKILSSKVKIVKAKLGIYTGIIGASLLPRLNGKF